ncbi:fibronectin type III domain-containing protein [Candidatus Bipolaricaulota bacterium]
MKWGNALILMCRRTTAILRRGLCSYLSLATAITLTICGFGVSGAEDKFVLPFLITGEGVSTWTGVELFEGIDFPESQFIQESWDEEKRVSLDKVWDFFDLGIANITDEVKQAVNAINRFSPVKSYDADISLYARGGISAYADPGEMGGSSVSVDYPLIGSIEYTRDSSSDRTFSLRFRCEADVGHEVFVEETAITGPTIRGSLGAEAGWSIDIDSPSGFCNAEQSPPTSSYGSYESWELSAEQEQQLYGGITGFIRNIVLPREPVLPVESNVYRASNSAQYVGLEIDVDEFLLALYSGRRDRRLGAGQSAPPELPADLSFSLDLCGIASLDVVLADGDINPAFSVVREVTFEPNVEIAYHFEPQVLVGGNLTSEYKPGNSSDDLVVELNGDEPVTVTPMLSVRHEVTCSLGFDVTLTNTSAEFMRASFLLNGHRFWDEEELSVPIYVPCGDWYCLPCKWCKEDIGVTIPGFSIPSWRFPGIGPLYSYNRTDVLEIYRELHSVLLEGSRHLPTFVLSPGGINLGSATVSVTKREGVEAQRSESVEYVDVGDTILVEVVPAIDADLATLEVFVNGQPRDAFSTREVAVLVDEAFPNGLVRLEVWASSTTDPGKMVPVPVDGLPLHVDTISPDTPANLTPREDSLMNEAQPVLDWDPAPDNEGGSGVARYEVTAHVQIFEGGSWGSKTSIELEPVVGSTSMALPSGTCPEDGNYRITWSVTAIDRAGHRSNVSSEAAFFVDREPPTVVAPVFPSHGSVIPYGEGMRLQWKTSEDTSISYGDEFGVQRYVVDIHIVQMGDQPDIFQTRVVEGPHATFVEFSGQEMNFLGELRWWVHAMDAAGNRQEGAEFRHVFVQSPMFDRALSTSVPLVATLNMPADGQRFAAHESVALSWYPADYPQCDTTRQIMEFFRRAMGPCFGCNGERYPHAGDYLYVVEVEGKYADSFTLERTVPVIVEEWTQDAWNTYVREDSNPRPAKQVLGSPTHFELPTDILPDDESPVFWRVRMVPVGDRPSCERAYTSETRSFVIDRQAPAVTSIAASAIKTDGSQPYFEVAVRFDEAMSEGVHPTVTMTGEDATTQHNVTLSASGGRWTAPDLYLARFHDAIPNAGVVHVSEAADLAGNPCGEYEEGLSGLDAGAPPAPEGLRPAGNALLSSVTPALAWNDVEDLGGSGIARYVVKVTITRDDRTETFSYDVTTPRLGLDLRDKLFVDATTSTMEKGALGQDETTTTTNRQPIYQITWKVLAIDRVDNVGSWSESASFKVDSQGPAAVDLVSPAIAIYMDRKADTLLVWNPGSDRNGGEIDSYEVDVDWSNGLGGRYATKRTQLLLLANQMPEGPNEHFTWRVRAIDNAGNRGDYSEARTVHIQSTSGWAGIDLVTPGNGYVWEDPADGHGRWNFVWERPNGPDSLNLDMHPFKTDLQFTSIDPVTGKAWTIQDAFLMSQTGMGSRMTYSLAHIDIEARIPMFGSVQWQVTGRFDVGYPAFPTLTSETRTLIFPSTRPVGAVGGLVATTTLPDRISLEWTAAEDADWYGIFRREGSGPWQDLGTTQQLSLQDIDTLPGATWEYAVRAIRLPAGRSPVYGELSSPVIGRRAAPTITDVTASDGTSTEHVTVTWEPEASATAYRVHRHVAGSSGDSMEATTPEAEYTDDTAVPGVLYEYRVCPLFGSGDSSGLCEESLPDSGFRALGSPAGIAVRNQAGDGGIEILWGAVLGAESYEVARADLYDGSYETIPEVVESSNFADTPPLPDLDYWYKVRACASAGCGEYSESEAGSRTAKTLSLTVKVSPWGSGTVTPAMGDHSYLENQSVDIIATANSGYRFDHWEGAVSGTSPTASILMDGIKSITAVFTRQVELTVAVRPSGAGTVSGAGLYDAGSTATTTVTAGSGYCFDHWEGDKTGSANPVTHLMDDDKSVTAVFLTAPARPTGVDASDGSYCDKVQVSWDAVFGASSYKVYRAPSPGGTYSSIGTTGLTSYDDTSAAAGATYSYKVKAFGVCGEGPLSEYDSGYRIALPETPTGINASDGGGCNYVAITWGSVAGATEYELYRSTSFGSGYSSLGTIATTYWEDSSAVAGTTYYYKIRAINDCGESSLSRHDSGYRDTSPDMPTGVNASDGTYSDKVRITWSEVSGAVSYDIRRATSSGGPYAVFVNDVGPTTYDDMTAVAGTTYYYKVLAKNACGSSGLSDHDAGTRSCPIPGVPAGVSATDGTYCDKVRITWSAVSGATSYDIRRATSLGGPYAVFVNDVGPTTYDDVTAVSGTTYYYKVLAKNACGSSDLSNHNSGYRDTSPDMPTGVNATDGTICGYVNVTWDAVSGATEYSVYRATSAGGPYSLLGTHSLTYWQNSSAVPGTTYYYKVTAHNGCGESNQSGYDSGYRIAPPETPTGVAATDGDHMDKVQVTWDAVDGAETYQVHRATSSGGSYTQIGTTTSTSYNDTSAVAGTTYYYKIAGYNACTVSPLSDFDEGYRGAIPGVPGDVSASDQWCNQIMVSWSTVSGATSYKIYRATSSGGTYSYIGYNNTSPYSDNSTPGETFYYKVSATNDCGESALSDYDEGYRTAVPVAPTGVSATDGDHCDKVQVTWDAVDGAETYQVHRATSSGGSYSQIGTMTSTSYNDTSAVAGTTYYYKIAGYNACTVSPLSDYDSGYRLAPPETPTGLNATDGTIAGYVNVTWNAVSAATEYSVYRATSAGGPYSLLGTHSLTYWQNSSAVPGTTYYYKVKAVHDCGTSDFSDSDAGYRTI